MITPLITLLLASFSIAILPINPVYIMGMIVILLGFYIFLKRMMISPINLTSLILSVVFYFFQILAVKNNTNIDKSLLTPTLMLYSMLLFPISNIVISQYNALLRLRAYENFIKLSLFILLLDLVIRVARFDLSNGLLYSIKSGGMYFDSNFSSLVIISIMSLVLFLRATTHKKMNLYVLSLLILNLSTMSRAGIIAMILQLAIFYNPKNAYKKLNVILIIGFGLLLYLIYLFFFTGYSFLSFDGSFNSKFNIAQRLITYYESGEFNVLYGIGLGQAKEFIGIFAHNIFVTFVLEMGLIGSIIFLLIYLLVLKQTGMWCNVIWLPTMVAGLSLFSAYMPFLFVISGVLALEVARSSSSGSKI
ncbi:hypothetical protein C9980_20355 [Vibrio mediterranei]|uniref:hypothetical protein n=1 Tax=Vibrio mediterranei TaxID=689 RepID=UPI000D185397|nr:hypothetical protein [Vibrio mediterranei]PTC02971.1 hypothetical protein C9980_20355 [Vibrio mediterranei]